MRPVRSLSALIYAVFLTAPAAWADIVSLSAISAYLNGLKTAEARFTQINDDGSINTGKILLKRPGRMKFNYNEANAATVLASGNAVYIIDPRSNTLPETYPLRRTPLSLILARNVNLDQANMVVGHSFDGVSTVVTAQDPDHPEYGQIQMKFTDNPIELRQWIITDSGGGSTTIVLAGMKTGGALSNSLFQPPSREN